MSLRLSEIVDALGGQLLGDGQRVISRLASLERADEQALSFLADARMEHLLARSRAACIIVPPRLQEAAQARGDCIVTAAPHHYFARLTRLWRERHQDLPKPGIHPSAVVENSAVIDPSASIGALSYIGHRVRIGAATVIQERVTIARDCELGARCLVLSGAVIGADGFGFAAHEGRWERVEQLGAVRIGDDVEIGANTCIDRGALDDTVIENGVKLDNLIQIGHNCHIGEHTAMAGCVGVAGSANIGAHCTVGGAGMILGHLTIADHVHISSASMVSRSIHKSGHYTGFFPLQDHADWEKTAAALKGVSKLRQRVRALEKKLGPLEDG